MKTLILRHRQDRASAWAVSALAGVALGLWAPPGASAQNLPRGMEPQACTLDTGVHENTDEDDALVYTDVIQALNAPSKFRIHFKAFNLGRRSTLTLTSLRDGGRQKLDTVTMGYWQNTSAIFNGDRVRLELRVAPGESGIFAKIDQLVVDCDCGGQVLNVTSPGLPESLCGSDDRVASTDNRVGRISGCTAWLVSNGAVLCAGHCGPLGGVFEANVPASSSSGVTVASAPEDQYPVNGGTAVCVNNGRGDDYCVFSLNPNTTTGTRAHQRFGFFRMSRETPAVNATIRITGFGVDNTPAGTGTACCARDSNNNCTHTSCNAQSRTLQTATGTYTGETVNGASSSFHSYKVDTEPANSGSPIIWTANGFTVGIHTHGGCASDGTGDNDGTSFENDGLESTLQNFPGANTRYLDNVTYPNSPADNGTVFQPFHNLAAAVSSVPSGGRISVVAGSYLRTTAGNTGVFGTGNKAFTLLAPVGTVTIGN